MLWTSPRFCRLVKSLHITIATEYILVEKSLAIIFPFLYLLLQCHIGLCNFRFFIFKAFEDNLLNMPERIKLVCYKYRTLLASEKRKIKLIWETTIFPFNALPVEKFLDQSKFKAFADNKIKVMEKLKFVLVRRKTWWEKEKMHVPNIFSFSHNVFKRLLSLSC